MSWLSVYTRRECFDAIEDCYRRLEELEILIESASRFVDFSTRRVSGYNDRIVELKTDPNYEDGQKELCAALDLQKEENLRLKERISEKERYVRERNILKRDIKIWNLVSRII